VVVPTLIMMVAMFGALIHAQMLHAAKGAALLAAVCATMPVHILHANISPASEPQFQFQFQFCSHVVRQVLVDHIQHLNFVHTTHAVLYRCHTHAGSALLAAVVMLTLPPPPP